MYEEDFLPTLNTSVIELLKNMVTNIFANR